MTAGEFVELVRELALDSAVRGTERILQNPPRKPLEGLQQSEWFLAQTPEDREQCIAIARRTASAALFNLLCIFDGVQVVRDNSGADDKFVVVRREDGQDDPINEDGFLHELW